MRNNDDIDYAWLQISDLHIYENTDWNIMQKAYSKIPYKNDIGFITITGDLHQFGKKYENTKDFLEKLLELFKLEKKNVFIVPGNHDCGECDDKEAYTSYIEHNIDTDQDCYKKYFVKGKLIDCFSDYSKFITEFYGNDDNQYPSPEQLSVKTWKNKLNIIHLNTAINCNGNNQLEQIVDIYGASKLYEFLSENIPSIVIAHHAFDGIHKSHKESLTRLFSDWNVSVYLCGDLHKQQHFPINLHSGKNIPCIVCGKSSPENKDSYSDLGCIVYVKYKNSMQAEVVPYIWNASQKIFAPSHCFDNDNGRLHFELMHQRKRENRSDEANKARKTSILAEGESIWLPDAERAVGKQARFGSFTETEYIKDYINSKSSCWGLSSVKGIGKTFVLQIKRNQMSKERKCLLPLGTIPSANNGWGTEAIIFNPNTRFTELQKFSNNVNLWHYSIIVYSINQLININENVNDSNKWWKTKKPQQILFDAIIELSKANEISRETFLFCSKDDYTNLNEIIKGVLAKKNWHIFIKRDLEKLISLKRKIKVTLRQIDREGIAIFIDKVDQSLMQTNEDPAVSCEVCNIKSVKDNCKRKEKSEQYCNDQNTSCRRKCCYGCKKFIEDEKTSNKHKPQSLWQFIQLGLLKAVYLIKEEYEGILEIYFTIRAEAFSCEIGLLGSNNNRIMRIVTDLWYSKKQQKKIFYQCIENQREDLLVSPYLLPNEDRIEEAFVGVNRLCHPYVENKTESVFESIYRHSFDRTRDIQEYGEMLTYHLEEILACKTDSDRGEKVKELIEEKAAKLAFCDDKTTKNNSYYVEKMNLLPKFWSNMDNFKKLITSFRKNLMFGLEVQEICGKFNNITCKKTCKECPAKHHPFSMLYKLGMLGQIKVNFANKNDISQEFLDSKKVTYITAEEVININEDIIYILHPALTKSIESLNHKVKHFSGFILGKKIKVPRDILNNLKFDFENMDRTVYETKYFKDK